MALPLRSLLTYLARPGRRSQADHAAQRELAAAALRPLLPAGLEIEWLGTSGFRLSLEGTTLLIDPYLTRLPPHTLGNSCGATNIPEGQG